MRVSTEMPFRTVWSDGAAGNYHSYNAELLDVFRSETTTQVLAAEFQKDSSARVQRIALPTFIDPAARQGCAASDSRALRRFTYGLGEGGTVLDLSPGLENWHSNDAELVIERQKIEAVPAFIHFAIFDVC